MALPGKCCRSTPRCRDCPARRPELTPLALSAELAGLLTPKGGDLPPHLQGVPSCLHKYEPLFRRDEDGGETDAPQALSAPPS